MITPRIAGLLASAVILTACATVGAPPEPTADLAARSGIALETLRRGNGVYLTQCGSYHALIHPRKFKPEEWKVVAPGMCWNAGVNRADGAALMKYLLAASRNGS